MMNGGTASWHAHGFAIGRRLDGWFAGEVRGEGNFLVPTLRVEMGNDGYLATAAIPGSEKEELTVSVRPDGLHIAREGRRGATGNGQEEHASERTFSHFTRETRLVRPVDPGRAAACFADGVLTVTLPFAGSEAGVEEGTRILEVA